MCKIECKYDWTHWIKNIVDRCVNVGTLLGIYSKEIILINRNPQEERSLIKDDKNYYINNISLFVNQIWKIFKYVLFSYTHNIIH